MPELGRCHPVSTREIHTLKVSNFTIKQKKALASVTSGQFNACEDDDENYISNDPIFRT
jgi:hypothetical protein